MITDALDIPGASGACATVGLHQVTHDDVIAVAAAADICLRPLVREVHDELTGVTHRVTLACGSTRERVCPSCAAKHAGCACTNVERDGTSKRTLRRGVELRARDPLTPPLCSPLRSVWFAPLGGSKASRTFPRFRWKPAPSAGHTPTLVRGRRSGHRCSLRSR